MDSVGCFYFIWRNVAHDVVFQTLMTVEMRMLVVEALIWLDIPGECT